MDIKRAILSTSGNETDTVVVIDVLRAFTTTAYAFGLGVHEILLVAGIDEAFDLRNQFPDALLMGEIDGLPVDGFDLDNSPTHLKSADLSGRRLIHRTSHGTQGVIHSTGARYIFATGLCCAGATAQSIRRIEPASVTLLQTGLLPGNRGDEDAACADLLEGLLTDTIPSRSRIIDRVRKSKNGRRFKDPAHQIFPASDLALATQIDRFDFAMAVQQKDGLRILKPAH